MEGRAEEEEKVESLGLALSDRKWEWRVKQEGAEGGWETGDGAINGKNASGIHSEVASL